MVPVEVVKVATKSLIKIMVGIEEANSSQPKGRLSSMRERLVA